MSTVVIHVPCRTVSEANQREHWATRYKRKKQQQNAVRYSMFENRWALAPFAGHALRVRLVRIGNRRLDPDNLAGSFKHVQDAVAHFIGIDDGDEVVGWSYHQEHGTAHSVRIELEAAGLLLTASEDSPARAEPTGESEATQSVTRNARRGPSGVKKKVNRSMGDGG